MTPRVLRPLLHASTALVLLTLLDSPKLLKLTLLAGGIAPLVVETVPPRSPAVAGGLERPGPGAPPARGARRAR